VTGFCGFREFHFLGSWIGQLAAGGLLVLVIVVDGRSSFSTGP